MINILFINYICLLLYKNCKIKNCKIKGLENNYVKNVFYSIIIFGFNCNELFWNFVYLRVGRKCVKC